MFQRIQGVGLGLLIATAVVALAAFGTSFAQNEPQGTPLANASFVYQGRLSQDGVPAEGEYDFWVRFFDTIDQEIPNYTYVTTATVSNGHFSFLVNPDVHLDGDRVFIEVQVQNVGVDDSITSLGPRQELTPTPYAVYAMTAGELSSEAAAGFIQNGTNQQPTSNYNISGDGTAAGTLSASVFAMNGNPVLRGFGASNDSFAVGRGAGNNTATGRFNTMVGTASGSDLTTGWWNTGVGNGALINVSSGEANSALGDSTLSNLTSGSYNVAVGRDAAYHLTEQSGNTFVGAESGFEVTAGGNTAMGFQAGRNFTTGTENVFVGQAAGKGVFSDSTGSQNVAVGNRSGFALRSGSSNALFGDRSGELLTTGNRNTLLGKGAGAIQTSADDNVFVGHDAGKSTQTGSQNVFLGRNAGLNNTGGINTFVGFNAGAATTIGEQNLFLGYESGYTNTTGSNNTALGSSATFSANNLDHATAVGAGAQATASNRVQLGRNGTDTVSIGLLAAGPGATTVCLNGTVLSVCSSSLRYKTNLVDYTGGLDIVAQLRPVTFDWKSDGSHDLGFVAEDVAAIDPLLATYRDGVVEGVKYDRISAVLVNSVMEQQEQIDALASGVTPADEARLDALEAAIASGSGSEIPGWLYALAGAVIGSLLLPAARKVTNRFQ